MADKRPTLCVECGPDVSIDEDGCCVTCGNGATGVWLDNHPWASLDAHKEIDRLRKLNDDWCANAKAHLDEADAARALANIANECRASAERECAELRPRRAADLTADTAEDAAFQRGRESVEHWKQFATPVLTPEERETIDGLRGFLRSRFGGTHIGQQQIAVLDRILAISSHATTEGE